jgi:hypothetical protein
LQPGSFGAPQAGQANASAAPHSPQNFALSRFSVEQFGQLAIAKSLDRKDSVEQMPRAHTASGRTLRSVARYVALLRGINLGSTNRISMPELRAALEEAGFEGVRTHLQSGNVVLDSGAKPEGVVRKCRQVIKERFGLDIPVVVRTRAELAAVVNRNPLGEVVTEPKRYQVSFLCRRS